MITYEECRAWFDYDEDSGHLVRKPTAPYRLHWVSMASGYIHTNVRGKTLYEHRLVFLWHKGYLPEVVDHRDQSKGNNRIGNLREATHTQNKYNVQKRSHNTTGAKGVVFHPLCTLKPYQAKIVKNGKTHSLGYYPTVELAAAAYAEGAKRIAGEFANPDFDNERKNT